MTSPAGIYAAILLLVCLCIGCGGGGGSDSGSDPGPERSFAMGFTPWPYAGNIAAVGDTYTKIQALGDMINHHIDAGVPWPEAFTDQPTYHAEVEGNLTLRLSNTPPGTPVVLSVCPLNTERNAPVGYWGNNTNMPRPAPWDTYDFGDTELVTAYVNFLLNLINRFDPDYCNYGIEATEYIRNNPGRAGDLFGFLQAVYNAVKAVHPDLPLFISVTLQAPGSADATLVQGYSAQIAACSDLIGVSTYGYIFYGHADSGDPANLPADWLSQAQDYAPGLPIAIAETGWIAEDLIIPFYTVNIPGSATWQAEYVRALLAEADRLDALFVTWFSVVDFDDLWLNNLGSDPLAHIWRDTGLYDETVAQRQALDVWNEWLARPIR